MIRDVKQLNKLIVQLYSFYIFNLNYYYIIIRSYKINIFLNYYYPFLSFQQKQKLSPLGVLSLPLLR